MQTSIHLGVPQAIYLILMLLNIASQVKKDVHPSGIVIGNLVIVGLLYWGGFFS